MAIDADFQRLKNRTDEEITQTTGSFFQVVPRMQPEYGSPGSLQLLVHRQAHSTTTWYGVAS